MSKRRRSRAIPVVVSLISAVVLWLSVGVFVVQPIGAIPDGVAIVYWRLGTSMPFVSSADGIAAEEGGVSLLSRGIVLAGVIEAIEDRIIVRLPYSRTLYLISTGGVEYGR